MPPSKTEPAITTGTIGAVAAAILTLVVAFQPDLLTEDQKVAILGVVAVAAPLVVALVTRPQVTPNASVVERLIGTEVVAGEANDMIPSGEVVREVEPRHSAEGGV